MPSEDEELIKNALAGDTAAFGDLVERHQDRLVRSLTQMLGSVDEARDVAQEAFISAYEKLSSFQGRSAFYSWLFRIAYNAAVSQRRKEKRRGSLNHRQDQATYQPPDVRPSADPAHRIETDERRQMVREAVAQLAPEYRDALILKEIEGLKYEEIASLQDCPIGTVRSRIHRARLELREILARALQRES